MKKSPKSFGRAHSTADLLTKSYEVSAFMQFGLEFKEHKNLPTSQAIGYKINFGSRCQKLWTPFLIQDQK